ncbi:MAG: DNA primase [Planctomycetota bacterium]
MPVDVERIKEAHPIADVIAAHGVALRPSGRRFMGRCPFHRDDRPSLVVYPDTRSYYCFGCGAGGDVIDFIRRTRDLGFAQAVAYLDEQSPPPSARPARRQEPPQRTRLSTDDRLILTAACELYHEALFQTPEALRYLEERRIPPWLARRARLGYSDGRLLLAYLKRRRLSVRRAVEMGLLYADRRQGRDEREAMRGRIVIPDLRSGYCGWMTGRVLGAASGHPYLNLALSKPLLGYDATRGRSRVFLTEGPFDWLALLSWGLPACALLGTQPAPQAFRLLDRTRSVVIVLDNDGPGRDGAAALAGTLGDRATVITLPDGVKDVSQLSLLPDGRETFFQLLDSAGRSVRDAALTP